MVKHTETIRRQQPSNYLIVFIHFVVLVLKGLSLVVFIRLINESSVLTLFLNVATAGCFPILHLFKDMLWKRLIKKLRLISKFMMSHATQNIITIHILPNISRSNDNQAMKFGQLIAYKYFSSNIIQKKRQGD